jgi:D-methionine transport system substrate-binding protein
MWLSNFLNSFNLGNLKPLIFAAWQTFYMVFASSFLAILLGLCLGILIFLTGERGLWRKNLIHQGLGFTVNIIRSVPYIILLVALIPLTRLIVGTSIGTNAAIVSLTVAAIPFYARIVQGALDGVPEGLIHAGLAMGGRYSQILFRVILPEAAPNLIKGATLTVIGLIGYSAMAGAVGGGGLGQLAIDYGYERFDVRVMIETVIALVLLVQLVQWLGDCSVRHWRKGLFASLFFSLCTWGLIFIIAYWPSASSDSLLKVGVTSGPIADVVMKAAQQVAWDDYHLSLKIVTFDDYDLPNAALNDGELDANIFQHQPYLDSEIKSHGYKLETIAKTFVYPMGFYSKKISNINQLKDRSVVALPSDPSNEGRALLILQKAGLIHLKTGSSPMGSIQDVDRNPKKLSFEMLDAAQLPRALSDADLVAVNNDFARASGISLKDAVLSEGPDSPYANIIVVRQGQEDQPALKELVEIMHSKPVVAATMKVFPEGEAVPAWN